MGTPEGPEPRAALHALGSTKAARSGSFLMPPGLRQAGNVHGDAARLVISVRTPATRQSRSPGYRRRRELAHWHPARRSRPVSFQHARARRGDVSSFAHLALSGHRQRQCVQPDGLRNRRRALTPPCPGCSLPDVNAHDRCLGDGHAAPQQIYVAFIFVSSKPLIYYKYFSTDHLSVHWKPKLRLPPTG
jgi:hypothetical protein